LYLLFAIVAPYLKSDFLSQFALPKPKGGKYAINPILVEDQKEAQQRVSKLARQHVNVFDEDFESRNSPFATRDVYSRSAQLGYRSNKGGVSQWNKRFHNEPKKKTGKKK
jgi:RNA-binding protein NOB1